MRATPIRSRFAKRSLDWFDKTFVLVSGPLGGDWLEAGRRVVDELAVADRGRNAAPQEADGFLMGLRNAVLVRPDGHVAWRMPWLPADPAAELGSAMQTLLG